MILYRLLATLAAPILVMAMLWRVLRGQARWGDLAERFGSGAGYPGVLWLHGASNGELASAKRLVHSLGTTFPRHRILITSNTTSARQMVRGWGLPQVEARLAPVDLTWVLARFRARWRPIGLISLENELWPNRIATSPVPVLIVAARMSARSAARWQKARPLTARLFAKVDRLYPQDAASGTRFVDLGLPAAKLGPVVSLKSGVAMAEPPPEGLAAFQKTFRRPSTLLAASTHEGDEDLILAAFVQARQSHQDLRLILAPRHPRRSTEVRHLIKATSLPFAVRSAGQIPNSGCAIYLVDTLGEMPLWYALAGITIVGGTFSTQGGHTPFEPALAGSALIHGPDLANFADSYAALDAADAARQATDVTGLAQAICDLANPQAQQEFATRARVTLAQLDQGDVVISTIIADLQKRLDQPS